MKHLKITGNDWELVIKTDAGHYAEQFETAVKEGREFTCGDLSIYTNEPLKIEIIEKK